MKFQTKILQIGNNTGIEVSESHLEEFGHGKRPLVFVTINNYRYRSAVGKMGDKFMISLSSENRKNAGVNGGDEVEIMLEIDTEPRTVELPTELKEALDKDKEAKTNFEKLAPSKKKAMVLSITEAKTEETKLRRIQKALESLQ